MKEWFVPGATVIDSVDFLTDLVFDDFILRICKRTEDMNKKVVFLFPYVKGPSFDRSRVEDFVYRNTEVKFTLLEVSYKW